MSEDPLLAELERFRSRIHFTPESQRVWDVFHQGYKEVAPLTDNEGIEAGWVVGVVACAAIEHAGGDELAREVMPLVDEAVRDKRWGELDLIAFRILFGEMLLRSYRREVPHPLHKIRPCEAIVNDLRAKLAGRGITMPADWRNIRTAKA